MFLKAVASSRKCPCISALNCFYVFQIWNLPYWREYFKAHVENSMLRTCSSNEFKVVTCVLTIYIYTEPNGTLITNVSVISERHCFHTRTIIIYNIINIYKFVLVSSFLHVIFLELPLEIYNFKFPRSGKSSIISRITIKLGYDSKMSKTFLCPSIYSTVLTMTIGAQQLLCYNSDTVAASYSKMFGSKLHCIYIYIHV